MVGDEDAGGDGGGRGIRLCVRRQHGEGMLSSTGKDKREVDANACVCYRASWIGDREGKCVGVGFFDEKREGERERERL